ncbi:MAG TPA: choice-of-anchor J domain-containing protein [Bacteroidales bacterium]|nr:choice-of-anchor J domain-containing protein [Bacteroidales bacterium]
MKKILFLILFLTSLISYSQISYPGTPASFEAKVNKTNIYTLPIIDVEALKMEDAIVDKYKDRPWRFGQNVYVDIDIIEQGFDTIINGEKIWFMTFRSEGALTLNFTFDQFHLPANTELYLYNADKSMVLGAFNHNNNSEDGVFATTLIPGDEVTIEVNQDAAVNELPSLHLYRITHGYRNAYDYAMKSFGESGSCNVNVACPQAAGWEDQIRSVCMLVSGGSGFCSGALINNTNNDGTPYVLTANHCYSDPSSWVFWFNWQSPTCSNPSSSPSYNSMSGATLKARYANSDFCLVQINNSVPASYNVYFSGWNRTTDNNISGKVVGIHHPAGDIKKISWSTGGLSTTTYLENPIPGDGTHWRITSWSDGTTTEGGSSGSPIFDPTGHIVGQLHGGYAACGNTSSDWYGKLGVSWNGGGSSSNRLKDWLDPSNSGVTVLEGYDPNMPTVDLDASVIQILPATNEFCESTTQNFQAVIKNRGSLTLTSLKIYWAFDGGSTNVINWTGSLASNQTSTIDLASYLLEQGTHSLTVWCAEPNGGTDENHSNDTLDWQGEVFPSMRPSPFVELFNGTFPPACWAVYIGTNGLGTSYNWQSTSDTYEGTGAAFVDYENVSGGQAEDWLVTPKIHLCTNPVLTFYQKQDYSSNYGTTYSVRVSTTSQTSHSAFTTVSQWNESSFSTSYTKKTVDLSAYANQNVYVAFVMSQDDGDSWYIDSLLIKGNCDPTLTLDLGEDIDTICGQEITIDAGDEFATYLWSDQSTGQTITLVPQNGQNYTYSLTATDYCGCTYIDEINITCHIIDFINDYDNDYSLYWSNDYQALIFNNKSNEQIAISIYNSLGMCVIENQIINANSTKNIYLNNIVDGVYYSHITINNKVKVSPFIKY